MPLNGLYIIATPFFSRDSIQRQIVAIVAWLLRTFLRARRHAMLECARGGRGGWMNWAPVVRPSAVRRAVVSHRK